jgi:hypothetical protein
MAGLSEVVDIKSQTQIQLEAAHAKNRSKFQENQAVFTLTNFADRVASNFFKLLKSPLVFLEFFILNVLKFSNSPAGLPKTGETDPGQFLQFSQKKNDRFSTSFSIHDSNIWKKILSGLIYLEGRTSSPYIPVTRYIIS